jgi:hypothetical protein
VPWTSPWHIRGTWPSQGVTSTAHVVHDACKRSDACSLVSRSSWHASLVAVWVQSVWSIGQFSRSGSAPKAHSRAGKCACSQACDPHFRILSTPAMSAPARLTRDWLVACGSIVLHYAWRVKFRWSDVQGPYGSVTSPTQLGSHPNCVVGSRLYYAGTLCQAIRACTVIGVIHHHLRVRLVVRMFMNNSSLLPTKTSLPESCSQIAKCNPVCEEASARQPSPGTEIRSSCSLTTHTSPTLS